MGDNNKSQKDIFDLPEKDSFSYRLLDKEELNKEGYVSILLNENKKVNEENTNNKKEDNKDIEKGN